MKAFWLESLIAEMYIFLLTSADIIMSYISREICLSVSLYRDLCILASVFIQLSA